MGWRYVMFTSGALVFIMSILRITVIRLRETPKYLLGIGEDGKVVDTLTWLAIKYNRELVLSEADLKECGTVVSTHSGAKFSLDEMAVHFRGLFATSKVARSTLLIWLSWAMMGLVYPLFWVFLPKYLADLGVPGDSSPHETWRNYALSNISALLGPLLAGYLCNLRFLGRRYTMTIGALLTAAMLFGFTSVRTNAGNVGFSCAVSFFLNIYYGTLYAYTPEVLPSAHRATGNGVAVAFNRIMGILSAVIATFANTATTAPLYICAGLVIAMGFITPFFPFEPYGRRSS